MTDWKDNKGAGPWEFTKQPDKRGYINNPRWTNLPNPPDEHKPCGYWPRPSANYEYWTWHNFGMSEGVTGWVIIGYLKGGKETSWRKYLLFAEEYDNGPFVRKLLLELDSFPCMSYGVQTFKENDKYTIVYYGNHTDLGMRCIVVKDGIVFSDTVVFPNEEVYVNREFTDRNSIYADATGLIICATELRDNDCIAEPIAIYYTRRSTDFGSSWEDRVELYNSKEDCNIGTCCWYYTEGLSIVKTLDGKFYFAVSDASYYGNFDHEWLWYLAESTNDGQSWNQITTILSPADISEPGPLRSMWMCSNGNTIYCSGKKVPQDNRLYYSNDGGANWSEYHFNTAGQIYPDLLFTAASGSVVISVTTTAISPIYDIMRSSNGGANFSTVYTVPALFNFLTRADAYDEIFKVGDLKYITDDNSLAYLRSMNNGISWKVIKLPLKQAIAIVDYSFSGIDPVWHMPK